ncbi:serine/threonine-protein kinase [Anaeromyxobacter oryzae]|uniref:Protein kinase domain-containing protein n=1 Tax=Anaeromyxobacter oryzae TaxID=2918170 RepID=A0ABM7WU71_9BACT|nr:serine/threonine-protein kinase [Anaeromyxobacter oryzae]BDG03015.1 hypothetical protein AMOR_20110 [Anaeromyxobacter oryzae]
MNPEPRPARRDDDGGAVAAGRLSALLAELVRVPFEEPEGVPPPGPKPGTLVGGRFEILREVGRGGFGLVYEARDRELGRSVALKLVLPAKRLRSALGEEWLRNEADAAAQLAHPAITTLHDVGRFEGSLYLVYELLAGETLEDRLRRGPVPVADAVRIAREIAGGLAHAHGRGVIHRDLKPSNVFLTEDGRVKVLDFGLARILGGGASPGGGTPAYMAPEQWRGEPEDARSDVFAVGVILWQLVTGTRPYAVVEGRSAVLDAGPPPALPPRAGPPALRKVVSRAIARDREARPRDGRALEEALLEVERILAHRPHRVRTAMAAAVAAALAAGLAAIVLGGRGAPPPGPPIPVALADAANETGERALDGLSGLLGTALEQSRHLHVLTRTRLLDLVRQGGAGDAARLDPGVIRDVARRAGARAVLVPTIRRFDTVYAITLEALDPASDDRLFAVEERCGKLAEVPEVVDRLSARARRELQERDDEVRAASEPVQRSVTASLDAYGHYYDGLACEDRPSQGASWYRGSCAEHFERALAIDPGFALAHYELALLRVEKGTPLARQRALLAPALAGAARLPPKERELVLAWSDHLEGKDEAAVERYEKLGLAYPDDKRVQFAAASHLYYRGDLEKAVPWLERVVELDPGHELALDHLCDALGRLGRTDRLAALAAEWARPPATPARQHALSQARGWLGDAAGAIAAAEAERDAGAGDAAREDLFAAYVFAGRTADAEALLREQLPAEPRVRYRLAALLVSEGRAREAREELAAALADARSAEDLFVYHARLPHFLLGFGDLAGLRAEAERIQALDPDRAATLAVHFAYAGDLARARTLAARLPAGSPAARLHAAIASWRGGDPAGGVDALRAILRDRGAGDAPLPVDVPAFLLGEALLDAGRDAEGVEALQRFQRLYLPVGWWRAWTLARSRLELAGALSRLGRTAEARAEAERLRASRRRADPDDPLRRSADLLLSRLPEGGP